MTFKEILLQKLRQDQQSYRNIVSSQDGLLYDRMIAELLGFSLGNYISLIEKGDLDPPTSDNDDTYSDIISSENS